MITNKEMFDLGFDKVKHYKKVKNGVSKYSWRIYGTILFSIEKDLGEDFGDYFQPTLRINNAYWRFEDLEHLKEVLTSLRIIDI